MDNNVAYVVKVFYPDDEPWSIAGIFDNREHALELVEWLEGNSMMDGCSFDIEPMDRNTAYV